MDSKNSYSFKIGIIGGTGLYNFEGLTNLSEVSLGSPFGSPSGPYLLGVLHGVELVFLARHGRGHIFSPAEVNYAANIWGMKQLGVTHIISVSAVGSLREDIKPGDIVIIDQFIDRTYGRRSTFFGDGCVAHVPFADPVCSSISSLLYEICKRLSIRAHPSGCYVNINGPHFSTRAESHLYRQWGASVVGMTQLTEAKFAREAEICYSTIALATDYDCWKEQDDVNVEQILKILSQNISNAKLLVSETVKDFSRLKMKCRCNTALEFGALTTDISKLPNEVKEKLRLLIHRFIK